LGHQISDKAFGEWISKQAAPFAGELEDRNVKLIADTLDALVKAGTLRIP